MHVSRRNYGICLLALVLALALVGAGWAQTAPPAAPEPTNLYRQAVALLEQADQQLTAENLSVALSLVKQCNEIFTRLQKESAAKLAERQLPPKKASSWPSTKNWAKKPRPRRMASFRPPPPKRNKPRS